MLDDSKDSVLMATSDEAVAEALKEELKAISEVDTANDVLGFMSDESLRLQQRWSSKQLPR